MMLMRCEYCEGRKTVPCPDCSTEAGTQAAERPPASDGGGPESGPPCAACGGRAEVECPGCLGTGFVDMPTFA